MNHQNHSLEFSLLDVSTSTSIACEMKALAQLIRSLNEAGVPYSLHRDHCAIRIEISTGY